MIRIILLLTIKFILGAESGASFSWSSKWQDKKPWYSEVPEAVDALLIGALAVAGYIDAGLISSYTEIIAVYIVSCITSYAGIQSATWMFLDWTGKENKKHGNRSSTTKPLVDWIAEKFGWKLGDEGYSWIAAIVKGTIITLPLGGFGGPFFAFGYEIGDWFKRKGRDKYLPSLMVPHTVAEGMSFALVGVYASLFLMFCSAAGG